MTFKEFMKEVGYDLMTTFWEDFSIADKYGIAEARKLWRAVSAMHRGAEFRHGLVEDITGHQWSLNRYENDLLTAGCHRIAYNEMERIAKQLGWV